MGSYTNYSPVSLERVAVGEIYPEIVAVEVKGDNSLIPHVTTRPLNWHHRRYLGFLIM